MRDTTGDTTGDTRGIWMHDDEKYPGDRAAEAQDPAPELKPSKVACAMPMLLGVAVVVGMLLLFLYLLFIW